MAQFEKQHGPGAGTQVQSEVSLSAPRVESRAERVIVIPAGDRPAKDLDDLGSWAIRLAQRTGCPVIFSWDGQRYFAADKNGIKETSWATGG